MTEQLVTFWVIGIGVLIGVSLIIWSLKKARRSKWSVAGLVIVLGSVGFVFMQKEQQLIDSQIAIIRQELTDRFYMDYVRIELNENADAPGHTFDIFSDTGMYTAHFHPNETKGFKLDEMSGESLRGRRNAYEIISAIPDLPFYEGAVLEYQSNDMYTLTNEENKWIIHLDEHQVTNIVDQEGMIKYQNLPNEGETANEETME